MGEKTTFIEAKQRLTEQAELSRQEDFQRRAEEARLLESATSPPPDAVSEIAKGVSTSPTKTLSEQSGQIIAQGIKDAWSPPPDVVEAAKRLNIQRFLGTEPNWDHIETVCKWVLDIKSA